MPTCSNMPTEPILSNSAFALHQRVVAQFERHPVGEAKALGLLARERDLLLRQRHADDLRAVVLSRVAGERAPAAADVEHRLARLEPQLAADHVELLPLRRVEIVAPVVEIGAGVDHVLIEPQGVERIGDVVVVGDVALVLGLRSVALAVAADMLERPWAAARHEQKRHERAHGLERGQRLAQIRGCGPSAGAPRDRTASRS